MEAVRRRLNPINQAGASAEQQIMSGSPAEALRSANAAQAGLTKGSADWIRAQDIAMEARAQLEREKDRK